MPRHHLPESDGNTRNLWCLLQNHHHMEGINGVLMPSSPSRHDPKIMLGTNSQLRQLREPNNSMATQHNKPQNCPDIGEINKSWFWVLSTKLFFKFSLVVYYISYYKKIFIKLFFFIYLFYNEKFNKQLKKFKKKFIWQNSKSWFVYFTETENRRAGNELKIIYYVQTWPPDVKNLNWRCRPLL